MLVVFAATLSTDTHSPLLWEKFFSVKGSQLLFSAKSKEIRKLRKSMKPET